MENKLTVTPSPHITKQYSTNILMLAMAVALLPTAISGISVFGVKALYILLISTACAYAFDFLLSWAKTGKPNFLDYSSVVTGMMVGLVLPANAPLYYPVIGSFIAIVIFKFCFGGLGKNIFNPTAGARVVLGMIFSGLTLSMFVGAGKLEGTISPLSYFMTGDYSSITIRSLFFGTAPGAFGTVSAICILISGAILMLFGIIDFAVPVSAVLTFVATTWIGKGAIAIVPYLFSGSFLFAIMFMITDPVTSPATAWGRLVYGLLFGFIAGLFRVHFVMGETGVFIAVLIVNLISPLLDKIFAPHPIGVKGRE